MANSFTNYVVDMLRRMDQKYDLLIDEVMKFDMELKNVKEVMKRRKDERRSYEKVVFDMLINGLNYSKSGNPLENIKVERATNGERVEGQENLGTNFGMASSILVGQKSNKSGPELFEKKLDPCFNELRVKEKKSSFRNSGVGEITPSLKFATVEIQPCMQSFVVGETPKDFASITKVLIKVLNFVLKKVYESYKMSL